MTPAPGTQVIAYLSSSIFEVDGATSVHDGHDIVDVAEHAVAALFPDGSEVIGHLQPAWIVDERLDDRVLRPRREV